MNIKNLFKDYRKLLAITFAILGAAFVVADFGVSITMSYMAHDYSSNVVFTFINFAIMCLVCFHLLNGNINSNYSAYRGMAMFIFLITFGYAETVLINAPLLVASIINFDIITLAVLLLMIGAVVVGILSYIRVRRFLYRRNVTYRSLFWLTFAFTAIVVISSLLLTVLLIILNGSFKPSYLDYASLGDAFLSISVLFTVTRLSPRYY